MLTLITMDEGHTVDRAVHRREPRSSSRTLDDELTDTGPLPRRRHAAHRLEFTDDLVQDAPDGNPTQSVAGEALLDALSKETPGHARGGGPARSRRS